MKEEVFRYGENDRGYGMMSLPAILDNAPVVIIFNSGLIQREGPYRLNVHVCRNLADCGFIAIRIDLSGKGDTPAREGLVNRESVALDWKYIKESINARFGKRSLTLMGLCSGADNAIKITADEKDVKGLILLDPVSPPDADFHRRALKAKLTNIHKWLELPANMRRRFRRRMGWETDPYGHMASLRDLPTFQDSQRCFTRIVHNNGRVLAIFTSQAVERYNQEGQFARAMNVVGFDQCCEEVFWPQVEHIFPVQVHRDRLVEKIRDWAQRQFNTLNVKVG
jgi:pimeloyl-ACP methyl ester carboxylesterase